MLTVSSGAIYALTTPSAIVTILSTQVVKLVKEKNCPLHSWSNGNLPSHEIFDCKSRCLEEFEGLLVQELECENTVLRLGLLFSSGCSIQVNYATQLQREHHQYGLHG